MKDNLIDLEFKTTNDEQAEIIDTLRQGKFFSLKLFIKHSLKF